MENTLNGEKSVKIMHISASNRTPWETFQILSSYLRYDWLSQRTISRYCPFNSFPVAVFWCGCSWRPRRPPGFCRTDWAFLCLIRGGPSFWPPFTCGTGWRNSWQLRRPHFSPLPGNRDHCARLLGKLLVWSTAVCLKFRQFYISEVWKVANFFILVMESNIYINLGLNLKWKIMKVNSRFSSFFQCFANNFSKKHF